MRCLRINLDTLEPHVNGPFSPDLATPISKMKEVAAANGWPVKVEVGLIGSCTNSRISDLREAAKIINGKKVHPSVTMLVVPGSQQVKKQAEAEGLELGLLVAQAGEHDDRRVTGQRIASQQAAGLEAVLPGHLDIENHQVGAFHASKLEGLDPEKLMKQ